MTIVVTRNGDLGSKVKVEVETVTNVVIGHNLANMIRKAVLNESVPAEREHDIAELLSLVGAESLEVYEAIVHDVIDSCSPDGLCRAFRSIVTKNGWPYVTVRDRKIDVIKALRQATTGGLRECKETVETWLDQNRPNSY